MWVVIKHGKLEHKSDSYALASYFAGYIHGYCQWDAKAKP